MKFPPLVKKQFCKTPAEITVYGEGMTENGAPEVLFESKNVYPAETIYPSETLHGGAAYCNYQSKAKTVLTDQKKIVQVSSTLLISGDIAPNAPTVSGGYVVIDGVKRDIIQGIKARNPDGTVNFTQIEVV